MENEPKSLYEIAREVSAADSLHMMRNAKTDEEMRFWAYVHNMNLQRAQKIAIENNVF